MAGLDYLTCETCGDRLLYDGDRSIRDALDEQKITLSCSKCVKKLQKRIIKLEVRKLSWRSKRWINK